MKNFIIAVFALLIVGPFGLTEALAGVLGPKEQVLYFCRLAPPTFYREFYIAVLKAKGHDLTHLEVSESVDGVARYDGYRARSRLVKSAQGPLEAVFKSRAYILKINLEKQEPGGSYPALLIRKHMFHSHREYMRCEKGR